MNKKERSINQFQKYVEAFRCPLCKNTMKIVDHKSLVCSKNHTFDFSKNGYVNLLSSVSSSYYKKELFESRQQIVSESYLFHPLHESLSKIIAKDMNSSTLPYMVLDAGCGEGSHLQKIMEQQAFIGVGLDISKEGIQMAAKRYRHPLWIVGDLANLPIENDKFHTILNILSPSNYKEFKRILVPGGLLIKVVPRSNYLRELREVLFERTEKESYKNDATVALFTKHFQLLDIQRLSYTTKLTTDGMRNLIQMTPLAWSAKESRINTFLNEESTEITIDFDILIGRN
ncbi:methyltransferase domain-containing protein [Robertmurraya yapensis]|uniref:Methyltransferase domain-containing protein n=2 Tax=Bacillaceae TaxID=186817 RepID=A0A431VYV7_9BACI|nr:methyltransferase domain-containing protein [Bacillus yapensis]RTR28450.1 methyltransferase domain-containing protein [Bacillus yapensis]TKS94511.1 methyltransferase domain-containing protein [Bacillus yapensis]